MYIYSMNEYTQKYISRWATYSMWGKLNVLWCQGFRMSSFSSDSIPYFSDGFYECEISFVSSLKMGEGSSGYFQLWKETALSETAGLTRDHISHGMKCIHALRTLAPPYYTWDAIYFFFLIILL